MLTSYHRKLSTSYPSQEQDKKTFIILWLKIIILCMNVCTTSCGVKEATGSIFFFSDAKCCQGLFRICKLLDKLMHRRPKNTERVNFLLQILPPIGHACLCCVLTRFDTVTPDCLIDYSLTLFRAPVMHVCT